MKRLRDVRMKSLLSGAKPCTKCGEARWKTIYKNEMYECRSCGAIRKFDNEPMKREVREGME